MEIEKTRVLYVEEKAITKLKASWKIFWNTFIIPE